MGKGFGIAALVVVFFSFGIPLVGAYVTFIGLALAIAAALAGDKPLTIAAVVLAAVKLYLITPTWLIVMKSSAGMAGFTLIIVLLPVGAMVMRHMSAQGAKAE